MLCINAAFSQSRSKLDSLEKLAFQPGIHDTVRVKRLNHLADKHLFSDPAKARTFATKALTLAEKTSFSREKVHSNNTIGNSYYLQGNYASALDHYLNGLKIVEQLGDKKGIANGLLGVGNIYAALSKHELALEYQIRSLKMNEELGDKDRVSGGYNNIGVIYMELGDYDKALEYQKKSLKMKEEIGDKKGMSSNLGNIGSIYFQQQKYDEALDHQLKALKIRESMNNRKGLAMSYIDIGRIYEKQNKIQDAIDNLEKGIAIGQEISYKMALKNAYLSLSSLYEKQNQVDKAFTNYKLYTEIKDSIFNTESSSKLIEMQTKFETEKKEKEIALLTKEKQIQRLNIDQQQSLLMRERLEVEQRESQIELLNKHKAIKDLLLDKKEDELTKQKLLTETGQKEILLQKAESGKKTVMLYGVAAVLGLLMILATMLYKSYKNKQRSHVQLEERNKKIEQAYEIIEKNRDEIALKNKDITDSINYAKRIQQAILPPMTEVKRLFPESFILYRPKAIVCGDFYWFQEKGNKILFAAVDCTGHGVPGAFMSLVGNSLLNQSVNEHHLETPAKILNEMNMGVTGTLRQTYEDSTVRDGMDMALCAIEKDTLKMEFSGANNPVWIVRKKTDSEPEVGRKTFANETHELLEIKGDKIPVGIFLDEEMKTFTNHSIQLEKGDMIYVSSDGFADQFGGPKGKKFKYRNLQEKLFMISQEPAETQRDIMKNLLEEWRGNLEQVDDILIIGVRV